MKLLKQTRKAACITALLLTVAPSLRAQLLTKVDVAPTNTPPAAGSYTPGTTFTITSDGAPFFGPAIAIANAGDAGDVMTFAYETVIGDFDKRVKITGISGTDLADEWTRGALQVRTSTNSYSTSFHVVASNPQVTTGNGNGVGFVGRALNGQNYTWFSRNNYKGVDGALPNQWLRLRRVGDYFTAYVGTNGTSWTLIGQRYQKLPTALIVGPYAASGAVGTIATVNFANYGDTPLSDAIAPTLVSAGTLDKKVVGVKFSEAVKSSAATVLANYQVTQVGGPVTITSAQLGIAGDAVYLSVSGLTADTFSVNVIGGIQDTAGNAITPNQTVAAKALNWNHDDQGYIQNTAVRPQPGDDPGTVGQAVMISSDENPEVEIVGGGSNSWNPGDFIHYIWRTTPLSGNFDVTVAVSRNDRAANGAGYGNSGIMLRAAVENAGDNPDPTIKTNLQATQVQMVLNTTYQEGAGLVNGPGRGAIPLWRTETHGGFGNGNAGFGAYGNVIGGVKGYYSGLRGIDASGNIDPQSIPDSARYLRIKRVGTQYTFYASWNRTDWALVDSANLPELPDQLLLGFSTMNDTGGSNPPFSAYGGNGHELDPADPYNPENAGGNVQNESNYSVQRIKIFPNGVTDPVPASLIKVDVRPIDEQPAGAPALAGSWTSTGTFSFDMTGGGTGSFRNTGSPDTGGDEVTFAYETISGDFDKQVQITSLTNRLFLNDGSAYDYVSPPPVVDQWARAGLLVRDNPTNAYSQCLKLVAANPEGANVVRIVGRGIDGQNYTTFSGDYGFVSNALPKQYLRMKRVGNSFSCYVSGDGVVWSLIGTRYQEMPSTVYFGPYCAASLSPTDITGNPDSLLSLAQATFTAYNDVDLGDLTGPTVISAGTLDKKTIGVKFSEKISSTTATVTANYSISQGTVTAAKVGISGDSVYLTVTGLSADAFTVTVTNVTDTAGNKIAANSSVNGKASGWVAADIGFIQNPSARPTVGDDPYRVGQSVATSSDDAPEVEIIGGGSNAWNGGDYLHYVYNPTALTGDFDVAFKISHYEHPDTSGQGGYSWGGVELRSALYNTGQENTVDGTKVPMIANTTYYNYAGGPGRSAIPLWRNDIGGGYGNGNAGFTWNGNLIDGIKGYFPGINATNSVGTADVQSSPFSARWLRIKRAGTDYTFYASYNGLVWEVVDTKTTADITITGPLLLGYATMTDAGGGTPPSSAYGGNGHTIDPLDPLNPDNAGGSVMNESNYAVERVRLYSNTAAIGAIKASNVSGQVSITYSGTLVSSSSTSGPWTVVTKQASPYLITPTAGSKQFYRVIP